MWLLALLFSLEMGYAPQYQSLNVIRFDNDFIQNENVYYITMDTEVILFDYFFIGGSVKTFIQPKNESYQFLPIENDYLFKAGLRFKNIEAGFRHLCIHPVDNSGISSQGKSFGGYEEFYIKISGGF